MRASRVKENRLRRMASRRGLTLRRSPRRDKLAIDYGLYAIVPNKGRGLMHQAGAISIFALTMLEVEAYLDA